MMDLLETGSLPTAVLEREAELMAEMLDRIELAAETTATRWLRDLEKCDTCGNLYHHTRKAMHQCEIIPGRICKYCHLPIEGVEDVCPACQRRLTPEAI